MQFVGIPVIAKSRVGHFVEAEASVFCSAVEAALCDACDRRVHHANKLASKHHRFSLLNPSSSKDSPRCDICQERRAFQFCREDRAMLCYVESVISQFTQQMNTPINIIDFFSHESSSLPLLPSFLLLPPQPVKQTQNITSSSNGCDVSIDARTTTNISSIKKKPKFVSDSFSSGFGTDQITNTSEQSTKGSSGDGGGSLDYFNQPTPSAAGSTSSISEYLFWNC